MKLLSKCVTGLLAVSLLSGVVQNFETVQAAEDKLVVYAALNEDHVFELEELYESEHDVDIEILRLSGAGELATRVVAEKDNPVADVAIGGSIEYYDELASKDALSAYQTEGLDIDSLFLDDNGFYQGWYLGVLGMVINTESFEEQVGGDKPQTWDDLLEESYKDQILNSNPSTSGGGYIFLANQIFRKGEEDGWKYIEDLNNNIHHYTQGAIDPIAPVATGEFPVGISWAHAIVSQIKEGYPIEVIVPEQTAYEIGGSAIINGAPNEENAKEFMDWLQSDTVSEFVVNTRNNYSVHKEMDAPEGMVPFEEIDLVDYDRKAASDMKEDVIRKFEELAK